MTSQQPLRVSTIGYEGTTMERFLARLVDSGVDLLVDVRAVANSRRPGFSKNQLAANLAAAGIGYAHLRGLGTPAEGRAAARGGDHERMREIFTAHLDTIGAQVDLAALSALVESNRRVALMCIEADPLHCHRTLVADALRETLGADIVDLRPDLDLGPI